MSAGFNVDLRNTMLDDITALADSGATAALLRVYEGTRPATGASIGGSTLLVEVECDDPFAPSASGGILFPTIPAEATIVATGTAQWWRLVDSTATVHVMDGDVGGEMIINFPDLVNGEPFTITAWTITAGNA